MIPTRITSKSRGIRICYKKHFLFLRRRRDLLYAHLCAVLLWGFLFWHTLGLGTALAYSWPSGKSLEELWYFDMGSFSFCCYVTLRYVTLCCVMLHTPTPTQPHKILHSYPLFPLTLVHSTYCSRLQTTCTLRSLTALITILLLMDWMGRERST